MTTEITESWYNQLIEELTNIITETSFTSRWSLVEGYHQVGTRILQENENFERAKIYNQDIVQRVATSLGKKSRTIYYAMQFAKTYPDLNLLPEGKDTSWHHIVNKYLTDGTEKKVVKKADLHQMLKEIRELLNVEYQKAHQEAVEMGAIIENDKLCMFIHYLQDQFNKIVGKLEV